MKFKILYVVPDFFPNVSGYANACTGFVRALAASSHYLIDVVTFSRLGDAHELNLSGVRIHRIHRPRRARLLGKIASALNYELRLSRMMVRLDAVEGYDFIFFETAEFPLAQLYALRRFGNRVIVRVHAAAETEWTLFRRDLYIVKRIPTRLFIRKVRNILSTTPYYLEFIRRWYLNDNPLEIADKRFYLVPNTVAEANAERETAKKYRDASDGRIRFITLGRMDYYGELQKNFSRVLSAISLLRGRPYFHRLQLIVIGDGDYRDILMNLAQHLGLADTVLFHRSLPNAKVQHMQQHCDGVILASTFEGMSVFALEALANGAPLLVSGTGGLRELVDEGKNGVQFDDPLDIWGMAQKIDFFVENVLPKIDSVRRASRQKYLGEFSNSVVERRMREVLGIIAAHNFAERKGNVAKCVE